MEQILKNVEPVLQIFERKFGYRPTVDEMYSLYSSGEYTFSDQNENALIAWFEANNLR